MKSSTTSGAGSLTPGLPRGLSLIIHVIMLVALGLTLHSHREHDSAMHGRADAVLTGLVAAQVLLYLLFFTLPAQIRWPAWPWFRITTSSASSIFSAPFRIAIWAASDATSPGSSTPIANTFREE